MKSDSWREGGDRPRMLSSSRPIKRNPTDIMQAWTANAMASLGFLRWETGSLESRSDVGGVREDDMMVKSELELRGFESVGGIFGEREDLYLKSPNGATVCLCGSFDNYMQQKWEAK